MIPGQQQALPFTSVLRLPQPPTLPILLDPTLWLVYASCLPLEATEIVILTVHYFSNLPLFFYLLVEYY